MDKRQSRLVQALFTCAVLSINLLPLLALLGLISVSALVYDVLRNSERHAADWRVWKRIAQQLYFSHEANIWQSQKECVSFDEELLYVPTSGCSFSNLEFQTKLSFSSDGRVIESNSGKSGPPIFVLGDSLTMGWGVNDDETYSSLMAEKTTVPILNLGVSSYGTARELIWATRHPKFTDALCILIQYNGNDLDENQAFLSPKGLPKATPDRYRLLTQHKPRRLSFLDVMVGTIKYSIEYPWDFFGDLIGWTPVLWIWEIHQQVTGGQDTINKDSEHVDAFLKVLRKFPKVLEKTVFVIVIPRATSARFASALMARADLPNGLFVINIETADLDLYPLDGHENKVGHSSMARQIIDQMELRRVGHECLNPATSAERPETDHGLP
jgi:hypothetical protein